MSQKPYRPARRQETKLCEAEKDDHTCDLRYPHENELHYSINTDPNIRDTDGHQILAFTW